MEGKSPPKSRKHRAPPPPPVDPPSAESRLRRTEGGERLTVYLPPDIEERFRVQCARERRSRSDAATEAIVLWLERRAKR